MMMETASLGKPTVSRTMTRVTVGLPSEAFDLLWLLLWMTSMKTTHQSTDMMMETASLGKPTVSRTMTRVTRPAVFVYCISIIDICHEIPPTQGNLLMTRVTRPACGIPAAPMLAAVAVIEMMITWGEKHVKKTNKFWQKLPPVQLKGSSRSSVR